MTLPTANEPPGEAHGLAAERAAWARLVAAMRLDHRVTLAGESEKWCHLSEEWRTIAESEISAAKQALRNLGVDVDALLKRAEKESV